MKKTQSCDININASAQQLWAVLADIKHWPDWNPIMPHIAGTLETGQRLRATLVLAPQRQYALHPRVVRVYPQRELMFIYRWALGGLFDCEHDFTIEAIDDTHCQLTQTACFRGVLIPWVWWSRRAHIDAAMAAFNRAFAARVQALPDAA